MQPAAQVSRATPHRKRPQGPPFVSKVFTMRWMFTPLNPIGEEGNQHTSPFLPSSRTLSQRIHELRQPVGQQIGIATVTASSVSSLSAPILPMQIHTRSNTHSVTIQTVPEPSDRTHTQRRPFFNAIQKPAQSEICRQPNGKPYHYSK
jgi:hypothetical protein